MALSLQPSFYYVVHFTLVNSRQDFLMQLFDEENGALFNIQFINKTTSFRAKYLQLMFVILIFLCQSNRWQKCMIFVPTTLHITKNEFFHRIEIQRELLHQDMARVQGFRSLSFITRILYEMNVDSEVLYQLDIEYVVIRNAM